MTLPGPGIALEVEDATGVVAPAVVVSHMAAGLLVDWLEGASPEHGPVTVRWSTPRGLVVLVCQLGGGGRYGELEPTADALQIQRRRAVRADLTVPVRVAGGGHGQTVNISATGLLVAGGLVLAPGDRPQLEVALPDDPDRPLAVTGHVLRAEDGLLGIEMVGLTPGQQDRLAHVVFEHQRVALRRRTRDGSPLRLVKEG